MLPKCIVFNGVAVFKTPACAKKDRIVQFSEIHHYASGHTVVCRSFIHSVIHSFRHFHEFLLTQASAAAANRFIGINRSRGAFKIVRILI